MDKLFKSFSVRVCSSAFCNLLLIIFEGLSTISLFALYSDCTDLLFYFPIIRLGLVLYCYLNMPTINKTYLILSYLMMVVVQVARYPSFRVSICSDFSFTGFYSAHPWNITRFVYVIDSKSISIITYRLSPPYSFLKVWALYFSNVKPKLKLLYQEWLKFRVNSIKPTCMNNDTAYRLHFRI
jgi:hypothetical protein